MLRILNGLFLFLLSSLAHADAVDAVLDKMMRATKISNYEGTLVIRQKDKLQAMHVKHGMNDKGTWESIESLSGEPRQVIRQSNKVTTIFPLRKLVTVSYGQNASPLHPKLSENRQALKKLYQLKLIGKGRVARKEAQILSVMPRDKFRYGYKYWLDKKTGLLLKCDLLNERGQIVEQLMFSSLNVLSRSPASHALINQAGEYQKINIDQPESNINHIKNMQISKQWQVQKLPVGFILIHKEEKNSSHGKNIVQHFTFSDGMSSVSVFIARHQPDEMALKGVSQMGAVNAFGLPVDNYHVTAIGEVPVATVRMIAESTRHLK